MSHELVTFIIALIALLNPVGSAIIYLSMTKPYTDAQRIKIIRQASVSILVILLLSAWMGALILKLFGITLGAFELAGGVIVLLTALSMVRGEGDSGQFSGSLSPDSMGIVPLALPIVAGPGAISTVIIYSQELPGIVNRGWISLICVLMAAIMAVVFWGAPWLGRLLGQEGGKVVSRIMGLILSAIALQMVGNGMAALMPGLA